MKAERSNVVSFVTILVKDRDQILRCLYDRYRSFPRIMEKLEDANRFRLIGIRLMAWLFSVDCCIGGINHSITCSRRTILLTTWKFGMLTRWKIFSVDPKKTDKASTETLPDSIDRSMWRWKYFSRANQLSQTNWIELIGSCMCQLISSTKVFKV